MSARALSCDTAIARATEPSQMAIRGHGGDAEADTSPGDVHPTAAGRLQFGDGGQCAMTRETDNTEEEEEEEGEGEDEGEEEVEEVEGASVVLSDDSGQCAAEDESHFITTHEIELAELSDHEGDCDAGTGSSAGWDAEEHGRVYSFVDYTFERARESAQIRLSIQDPEGIMSRCVLRGVDAKAGTLCEGAKCFVAAPGRVHVGGRLRGKEEHSSGTSSAVSELDDADKEVRNLTARAFRSLAQPYFDTINFSTSSESSASEQRTWSTFVDLKYGNVEPGVLTCQSLEGRGYAGLALARIKPPTSKIFALGGSPAASAQQIQLMGKFTPAGGGGGGGLIRLTETLNFRCNVQAPLTAAERRSDSARDVSGSRSTDEVTRSQRKPPLSASMEDAHKKSVFASSLIKNVLSKKMQFEQERKMERGEIREQPPLPLPPPPLPPRAHADSPRGRELHSQSSMVSESGSDAGPTAAEQLGDFAESGSCDSRVSRSARSDPAAETIKGTAAAAAMGTLLRSQNSAFRCWKDEDLEFQRDHKKPPSVQDAPPAAAAAAAAEQRRRATKMSHLFVPNIQVLSSEGEGEREPQTAGVKLRSDNTLYVSDTRSVATSKSPEIKINLRSVRDSRGEATGMSRMRDSKSTCLIRAEEFKCQALAAAFKGEASDKVPHFMVRDIRENKGKLQTPIHQVRDVRKLVKSSYHFVSLDGNDGKSNPAPADGHLEQRRQTHGRNPSAVSPIVIKCQSVNTNNSGKGSENPELPKQDWIEPERPSPGDGRSDQVGKGRSDTPSSEGNVGSKAAQKKVEKTSEGSEKKPESKLANQMALEKLQAAVKTMEELYVFEKNEWKRKSEPRPLTDSHVLSLLASEEHGRGQDGESASVRDSNADVDRTPTGHSTPQDPPRSTHEPHQDSTLPKSVPAPSVSGGKSKSSLSSTFTQTPFGGKPSKSSRGSQAGGTEVDEERFLLSSASADNYLTIPVKAQTRKSRQPPPPTERTPGYAFANQHSPPPEPERPGAWAQEENASKSRHSSMAGETPDIQPATVYHSVPLGIHAAQPQVYCFSPVMTPAPTLDPFQATQRKMLLDPSTGNYYLVDTPVQPATKRLYDPETGQYVDMPMPQPPMTPLPMPISPLALSPGAYGQTYMIYPGFMPAPAVIPSRALVQSQLSEAGSMEKGPLHQGDGVYMESPFYMSTGKHPPGGQQQQQQQLQQMGAAGRSYSALSGAKQPVISISSQQGPRIIAPPSFDGTTMSFVVEHR